MKPKIMSQSNLAGALALSLLLIQNLVHGKPDDSREDSEKEDIIKGSTKARTVSDNVKEKAVKKTLPSEHPLKADLDLDKMKCGETYDLTEHGYLHFELKTEDPCEYEFLGSRDSPKCTAAILCDARIIMVPRTEAGLCDDELLMITDNYEYIIDCGNYYFGKNPRIASPGNVDLKIYFVTLAPQKCIAFCNEEMEELAPPGVGKGVPIKSAPKPATARRNRTIGFSSGATGDTNLKGFTDCVCGQANEENKKIGSGEAEAKKFEYPWLGSVVFPNPTSVMRQQFCGGALISDTWFLTAAQCFFFNNISASEIQVLLHHHVLDPRLGEDKADDSKFSGIPGWDLPKETDESEESLRLDVQQIYIHPLFNEKTFDYDLALLRFKKRIDLDTEKRVRPICLPRLSEVIKYEEGSTTFVTAGWGLHSPDAAAPSRVLQKVKVPFVDKTNCVSNKPGKVHMCAGQSEGEEAPVCAGGQGSPLIYKMDKESWMIAGIVSAGGGCKNKIGLYTDIQEVLRWVLTKNKKSIYCKRYLE